MYQIVLMFHIIVAIAIIGLVLLQQSKSSDMGGSFGSGASGTVFGSQGSGGFLFKLTSCLVIVFFITSLSLSSMLTARTQLSPDLLKQDAKHNRIPLPKDSKK